MGWGFQYYKILFGLNFARADGSDPPRAAVALPAAWRAAHCAIDCSEPSFWPRLLPPAATHVPTIGLSVCVKPQAA